MSNNSFTTNFILTQPPAEVFNAINRVNEWWSEGVAEPTHKVNDEFIYQHEEMHYSKHKITELIEGQKVVWLTTDSNLSFLKNKTEWTGTIISFDISEKDGKTQLHFTHHGLTPNSECYKDCTSAGGWPFYLQSLIKLITTGKGQPDKREETLLSLS